MKVIIIAFGKLKNPGLMQSYQHYAACLNRYATLETIELKPEKISEKSVSAREQVQTAETKQLETTMEQIRKQQPRTPFFLLDETGKERTSLEWADFLKYNQETFGLGTKGAMGFVIGSSFGFSQKVKKEAAGLLSLGKMTLPHELARVVLTEQLFRGLSILAKHPYHHEGE